MDQNKVAQVAGMLQSAAMHRKLVSYQKLHAVFARRDSLHYRYRVLEEAARTLADPTVADYGCLMALANGLPGDDFFLRFKRRRPSDFEAVMGFASPGRSITKKRLIATSERARVYEHAAPVDSDAERTVSRAPVAHETLQSQAGERSRSVPVPICSLDWY